MLNVLQIATFFTEHGGVEKSVSDLSHALSQSHKVNVLCTTKGRTVRRVSGNVDVTAAGGLFSVSGRPFSWSFVQELNKFKADVVHYHLPCPMAVLAAPIAAPDARIKIATWHHDLVRHKLFAAASRPMVEHFLSKLDRIIVTAPPLIESTPLLRQFQEKCEVIPLGIDERKFSSAHQAEVLASRAKYGSPLLLFVGRLVYYKGCEVLLEAMKRVPDANLVMVGTGPLQGKLQDLITQAGLQDRIHLLGRVDDGMLRTLFHACDVFVLPSTLPTECFGLVQVEAMLCGKPVINTSLATGVPWVSLHAETGLTVKSDNVQELSSAINLLLQDEGLRLQLGANAQRRASAMFTLEKQVSATTDLYRRLLEKKNGRVAEHRQASR
jgi:glycosyltransferase involved in cell wall biosynthesis